MLLEAEKQCKAEHDTLLEPVIKSELSRRRRDVRASIQNALNAGDLHTFLEALVQTRCEEDVNEAKESCAFLDTKFASLSHSKLLRLVSNEDRKLLRQNLDKHVQNARIADLQMLRDIIPHSSVFDSAEPDPWCPVSASAKLTEKVTQLENKVHLIRSTMSELALATDLKSLRKAFASADRVFVSEKLFTSDIEQWQDDICQAVRNSICQADQASDLHEFRKDKHVWSLGEGKWWSEDLERTWKIKVQECELSDKELLEAAMNARRLAAEGNDYRLLQNAIDEAEKLGAEPDAVANAHLHTLRSRWQWAGWR